MQKLARTAKDAQKPSPSSQDMIASFSIEIGLVRPRRLMHRKLGKLGPAGAGIGHGRDTGNEQQAAVEEDDSTQPPVIGRAILGSRLAKFIGHHSVGAITRVVSIREHVNSPLLSGSSHEERLDGARLAGASGQLKTTLLDRSHAAEGQVDEIGGLHSRIGGGGLNLLCECHYYLQ
jgi:hypothetical protein